MRGGGTRKKKKLYIAGRCKEHAAAQYMPGMSLYGTMAVYLRGMSGGHLKTKVKQGPHSCHCCPYLALHLPASRSMRDTSRMDMKTM